nr:lactate racemase domain-containing protein [Halanaerobium hydrogeniformans]
MLLKYGRKKLSLDLPKENLLKVLKAAEKKGLKDPLKEVEHSLANPIASKPLLELLKAKKIEDLVIVVNDVSRYTPYEYMLPPILDTIKKAGLKKNRLLLLLQQESMLLILRPRTGRFSVMKFMRTILFIIMTVMESL